MYPFYRFGAVDPARDGWNLFSYARNNPVAFVDPDGERTAEAVTAEIQADLAEDKQLSMSQLSDGTMEGVLMATISGAAFDFSSLLLDPFKAGTATGEASTSGMGELSLAVFGDALRLGALVTPFARGLARSLQSTGPSFRLNLVNDRLPDAVSLLKPSGHLIGQAGSSKRIRILKGGLQEAQDFFNQLSRGGKAVHNTRFDGQMTRLPGGGQLTFRPTSTSGPPTIDVRIKGVGIREVKFVQ